MGTAVHPAPATEETHPSVLREACVERARVVIVTLPDHEKAAQIIRLVRGLAPSVDIVVRARYHRFAGMFESDAAYVADEEMLVGTALAERVRAMVESDRSSTDATREDRDSPGLARPTDG